MFTITYANLDADYNITSTETANFADLETFDMLDRAEAIEWSHTNEDGKRTGGSKSQNAEAEMREYAAMMEARRAA